MFGDIRAVERVQPSCQWSCVSYSHPAGCNLSSCQSEGKGLGFSAAQFLSFSASPCPGLIPVLVNSAVSAPGVSPRKLHNRLFEK